MGALPLIGRTEHVEAIDAALERVRRDREAACLAFVGGLGLGKTRLLAELAGRSEARGDLVLGGGGSEYEQGFPYGVVVGALDDYLRTLHSPDLTRLGDDLLDELGAVFPSLPGSGAAGALVEVERYRTHRAVRALLGGLAERRPLTLVLDDLHWADSESLELLMHLLRHPPAAPVLLALAFRPMHAAGPLRAGLDRACRDGRSDVLTLDVLSPVEADQLLDTAVPAEERPGIVRESGGNPFFLEQLGRAAGPTAKASRLPGSGVPPAVLGAIDRELAALSEHDRRLLLGGAVSGEPFDIGIAAAACELDDAEALAALDRLLAADIVRPTDAPRRFRFRHPLVRRAVYEASGAGWRLAAHGRVADALRASGAPVTAVAEHVARSATRGDVEAVDTLVEAAAGVSGRAPATAARWLQAALDLVPTGDSERRLGLLLALASSLGGAGRLEEAHATLTGVLAELPPEQRELRARAVTWIARLDHPLGRQGEARALLERTIDELPDEPAPERVALMLELVMDHLFTAQFGPMQTRAAEALVVSASLGDPLLEAAAHAGVAHAAQNVGDVPASLEAVRRGAALLDALDDVDCVPLLDTFWWLAVAEDVLELYDDALRHMERGIALARAHGVSFVLVALTQALAVVLGWRGPVARARELAREAVDAAHLSGNDAAVTYAYTTQCFVHARAGEARDAVRAGELAVEAGRSLRQGLFVGLPHANLGAALLEAGEYERARAQLLEARGRGAVDHWAGRCWWEIWMSGAELGLGRVDEAAGWADQAKKTAEEMGLVGRRASALVCGAAVALARGEREDAATDALAAAALFDEARRPVDAARARLQAGQALDQDRAITELRTAHAALTEAGAPRLADAAARQLRKLGERVTRTGARGAGNGALGTLSAREREIAELVATGLTNRDIAADLSLSEKTVENHLARVFAKLGISSRAALAGAVARDV